MAKLRLKFHERGREEGGSRNNYNSGIFSAQTDSYDDDGYGDDDNATARLTHCLIFSCAAPLKMKRVEEKEQVKQVWLMTEN